MKQQLHKMTWLRTLALTIVALLTGASSAWGGDIVITLDKIGTNLGSTANTTATTTDITATGSTDSYTLNYYQCKKQGDAMLMTKSVSPYISNKTAMPGNIKSVEVFINTGASGKTTYDCAFSATECTSATSGIGAKNITGGNSYVFSNLTSGNINVAGKYFCITLGNANNGQVLKLVITCESDGGGTTTPNITASSLTLTYDATTGSIPYSVSNPTEGTALTASTDASWISNISVNSDAVTFSTTANEGTEDRSAQMTLSYEGATDRVVTITQEHFVIDYATLPFNWDGGVKAGLEGLTGVSTYGLGSDYAESHNGYRIKFDNSDDYIQVKTNERPGVVTVGVKMIGGTSASSIKVQGSADGETFSDVETLTISGSLNDILTLSTSSEFAANVRYVRLLFVKGSNVGVGPISIARYGSVASPSFSPLGGTFYSEQSVSLSCATDGATIKYSFDNSTWNTYSEAITVSTTTTIYAKAVIADLESDVVSATYTIAEKNDVVFNITDITLAYGETYTVTRGSGKDVETDGWVTVTSDNAEVASVNGMTITSEAVGTATITLSVAEGNTYKAGEKTITVTVTAPEGQTTAPAAVGGTAMFDFSQEEEVNTNEWGLPVSSSNKKTEAENYSNGTYTITVSAPGGYYWKPGENNGGRYLLMGKSGATLTLPAFDQAVTKIDVEGTSGASGKVVQNIYVGETAVSTPTTGAQNVTNTYAINEGYQAAGTIYTLKVTSDHNTQIKTITIHFAGGTPVTESLSLPSSGVGTYCSQYPINLSALPEGVKAYAVESQTGTSVTLAELTGTIKGGVGFVLKGTAGTAVTFTFADSETVPSTNLLLGTLAPTYVAANTVYGMKSGEFHPNNAGTIPAHRAYLPAESGSTGVKALTLVFKDTDGIVETRTVTDAQTIFDLTGRRLQSTQKGVNIVNGRKVLVK
ncbi:MAG: chitobiase/beta-hexosaminidase C-terminal domain-containing protein [Bacteroidaceae bacterium]|nr:chitobiase/beta-hexosaminidase C-terminal domain-containing protein [Bacteroidaceae bacterium]